MAKKDIPVTCLGVKKDGKRCQQKNGLIDGYCISHYPGGKLAYKAAAMDKKASRKKVNLFADAVSGAEDLMSKIAELAKPIAEAGRRMKFIYKNGQAFEVPVDEPVEEPKNEISVDVDLTEPVVEPPLKEQFKADDVLDVEYVQIGNTVWALPNSGVVNHVKGEYDFNLAAAMEEVVAGEEEAMPDEDKIKAMAAKLRQAFEDLKEKDWYLKKEKYFSEVAAGKEDELEKRRKAKRQIEEIRKDLNERLFALEEKIETIQDERDEAAMTKWDKMKRFFKKWIVHVPSMLIMIGALVVGIYASTVVVRDGNTVHHSEPATHQVVEPVDKDKFANKPVDEVVPVDGHNGQLHEDEVKTYKVVKVEKGDTLWDMAVKEYGDGSQWTKIWDANKDMLTKADNHNVQQPGHWIHEGQLIQVPTN